MYNNGSNSGTSSPTLRNVTFRGNAGPYGGAMCNDGGNAAPAVPILSNVTFSGNSACRRRRR